MVTVSDAPFLVDFPTIDHRVAGPFAVLAGSISKTIVRAMRILVVEDERHLSSLVQDGLKRAGMQSDSFTLIEDAVFALRTSHYDAMILDLALPDGRGEQLLIGHHGGNSAMPVLILTAEDAVQSRVDCLNAGADDYLVKPFDMDELVARVRALLRRPGGALGTILTVGNVAFDTIGRHVTVNHVALLLSRRELAVLEHLLRRSGRVVPKELLQDKLYDADQSPDSNPIPVHIHNVRRKLSETGATVDIHTVRGLGYILREHK